MNCPRTCPATFFLNSKTNCIGVLSFLWSDHTFSWFFKSSWSSCFGHIETGSGAKKRVVLRREVFTLIFKYWENGVWTKIRFLGYDFLFTCGFLSSVSNVSKFDRFLDDFPNQFIVHSRSSFVQSMKIRWIVCQDLFCYVFFTSSLHPLNKKQKYA